ncbi:hypothetical protein AYK21_01020 [Thermoplasmatales archaeon SG8-52-2]|nr:MAG: hypothetical protein AYK21_01020 [Thermoplasmatales archaeon SG8-52-2]
MNKKPIEICVCIMLLIPIFSITISADQGTELEIYISDAFESKNIIVRYYHGLQIENVGSETATGIAVDFWVTGGIFAKFRNLLKMEDFWQYGCGKIEPGEKTYCPIHLNLLYLGEIELTAKVWADNAEPVTQTINGFASFTFIWVISEE